MYKNLSDRPIAEVQLQQADEWDRENLLEMCVENRKDAPSFNFYEGPPTANGKPGIHHVIARALKDSVCRYKTMQGFRVTRKAGWDTHGLPVEIEVEKQLGFSGKQDIEKYGIREFNEKCKSSVFTYEAMWRDMTRRMGYLVDMDHPYITLDNDYIETGWWIIKQFFDAGLIYEGHKIVPYCPRCGTGLASHEVAQGYKIVKVNTLTVPFKAKDEENTYYLAWTTTAWTLAANVALTVGADIDYVKALQNGKYYILAKSLADKILSPKGEYEIVAECKGKDLEFREYEQLMPFCTPDKNKKAFFITCMDYVSTEDGTGIVHTAPAFGEDDYNCGVKYGLPVMNPVDEEGKYIGTPWEGRFIMEDGLDVEIIKWLASQDKIYAREKIEHNYPHCWRCGTPLVYYAKPSWYIRMTALRDQLVANNNTVNWWPSYVGEGRFGNWIADVKDWAISRNRYWGTPIPIWRCPDCGKIVCVGSREELKKLAIEDIGEDIELHRPYVDDVHIACPDCGHEMSRIPEVMDCWFDSGAMPFAQRHYPFENKEIFDEEFFPADFICEGIDQTRGWFYSLMAISTFIKGQSPYRNVLVNDLILDKYGKKMSKHVGNTVDPFALFDKYGADATRWYLMSISPVWLPTKFDEEGLMETQGKFFGTLRNVYNFFILYANNDGIDAEACFVPYAERPELDRWILSKWNALVDYVTDSMDHYDHNKSVRAIQNFVIEDLSNWYIRRARRRFYADGLDSDKKAVYATTFEILTGLAKMMAPFAPFITAEIYKDLTGEEVHLQDFPKADASLIDAELEKRMDLVRDIVTMGRGVREKTKIKVRQPLPELLIDGKYRNDIEYMAGLIKEELNVKQVVFEDDMDTYLNYSLKPDFRAAGPVLGSKIKAFGGAIAKMDPKAVMEALDRDGKLTLELNGEPTEIGPEMVNVTVSSKEGFSVALENGVCVILDTTLTDELVTEGLARELVSKVQQMRKNKGLEMMDRIEIFTEADEAVSKAIDEYREWICSETLADAISSGSGYESFDLNGHKTGIDLAKK
ncbi:MAG: isoleucine--tRNA ligase [Firmicutes bacterium]|nr:isoleucine--tRNA ligase [Bacillota bacterium]